MELCPEGGNYRFRGNCPDGAEPLMKPIVAAVGDSVHVSPRGIAVKRQPTTEQCPPTFRYNSSSAKTLALWHVSGITRHRLGYFLIQPPQL